MSAIATGEYPIVEVSVIIYGLQNASPTAPTVFSKSHLPEDVSLLFWSIAVAVGSIAIMAEDVKLEVFVMIDDTPLLEYASGIIE